MRQIRTKLGLVIVCMATFFTAATLTACGDDEEADDPVTETEYTATLTYEYKLSEDALEVADFTATYTNAAGETVTEAITTTEWTASVSKTCPADFAACTVSGTLKEGLTLDPTRTYVFTYNFSEDLYLSDGTTTTRIPLSSGNNRYTLSDDNVNESAFQSCINRLGHTFSTTSVDANGLVN